MKRCQADLNMTTLRFKRKHKKAAWRRGYYRANFRQMEAFTAKSCHSGVIVRERGKCHRSVIVCCFCIWEQLKKHGFSNQIDHLDMNIRDLDMNIHDTNKIKESNV